MEFFLLQSQPVIWFMFCSMILANWIMYRYLVRDKKMTVLAMKFIPQFIIKKKEDELEAGLLTGIWIYFALSPIVLVMTFLVWVFYYGTGVSIGLYSVDVFGTIPKPMIIVSFFLGFTIIAAFLTDYVQRIDRFIQTYGMSDELDKIFTSNEEE